MKTLNLLLIIYVIFQRSREINAQKLPKPLDFLTFLLDTSETDLPELAKNFTFLGVEGEEVKLFLYTPVINNDNESTPKYQFTPIEPEEIDLTKPTKVYIHGWVSTIKDDYIKQLADIYVSRGPFNFIAVYWDNIASKNYLEAASSCKSVGKHVAHFLLRAAAGRTDFLRNVHLIGHSLGAQISGFAGKEISRRSSTDRVARITALDAAAPLFEFPIMMPDTHRITADDADYVESVHTNAGFLGFLSPVGQVDFYVNNGGPLQPGCLSTSIIDSIACSHMRAHEFYGQSVQDYIDTNGLSRSWSAVSCRDTVMYLSGMCDDNVKAVLGEESATYINGSYYLITKGGYKILDNIRMQILRLVKGFPSTPNNSSSQSFPSNDSNVQGLSSNGDNAQDVPVNTPNVPQIAPNNNNGQAFPSNNPNVQDFSPNNPYGHIFPSNNPNAQPFPLNNPNVQAFPSNNPNIQGFPSNNPYGQRIPSNNPNVQGIPSSNSDYQRFGNIPNNQGIPNFPFIPFLFQGNNFPNNKFLF